MSIEDLGLKPNSNQPKDFEAAEKLIENHPLLSRDTVAKKVVENKGVTEAGLEVDIGNYLVARIASLEGDQKKMIAMENKDPIASREAAMVVHSAPPEIENKLEDLELPTKKSKKRDGNS
ncbi:MAG: hypothetical protein Q7K26_00180 [bacterium]|nr:hypothetical protein [bacterium]